MTAIAPRPARSHQCQNEQYQDDKTRLSDAIHPTMAVIATRLAAPDISERNRHSAYEAASNAHQFNNLQKLSSRGLDVRPGCLLSAMMAKGPSGNSYELRCNDAYFELLLEAIKTHSRRTRRLQTLRKLIELSLHDGFWRSIQYDVDDIHKLLQLCGKGAIRFYVMLPTREISLLRTAKNEMQQVIGQPLSTLDMFAILLWLSLNVVKTQLS
jgi:hypothetical protein